MTEVIAQLTLFKERFPAPLLRKSEWLEKDMDMKETDIFKCGQCGALYDSEKELQDHLKAAHHEGGHAQVEDLNQQVKAKAKKA